MKRLLLLAAIGTNLVMGNQFQYYKDPLRPIYSTQLNTTLYIGHMNPQITKKHGVECDGPGYYYQNQFIHEFYIIYEGRTHLIFMNKDHAAQGQFYIDRGEYRMKESEDFAPFHRACTRLNPASPWYFHSVYGTNSNSTNQKAATTHDLLHTSTDEQPSLVQGTIQEIVGILFMPFFG
jgi:hypothetical protein